MYMFLFCKLNLLILKIKKKLVYSVNKFVNFTIKTEVLTRIENLQT